MTTQTNIIPLPATVEDWLSRYKLKTVKTLNDAIEVHLIALVEDPEFRQYIDAVYDEDSVTGKLAYDDFKAAELIQKRAMEEFDSEVASIKPVAVVRGMKIVLRRYGASREERREDV